jgi:hypothetical protein
LDSIKGGCQGQTLGLIFGAEKKVNETLYFYPDGETDEEYVEETAEHSRNHLQIGPGLQQDSSVQQKTPGEANPSGQG